MLSRVIMLIVGVSLVVLNGTMIFSRRQPAEPAWLAIMSDRDENWEIYRMRPDGSQQERLTQNDENDMLLEWSDDGKSISFLSWRDGDAKLYRKHLITGQIEALVDDPHLMMFPNFGRQTQPTSPNNEWVVFSARVNDDGEIGQDVMGLSTDYLWSPNGQMVAHADQDTGVWNLFRMRPDGSDLQRLTQHNYIDSGPIWSENSQVVTYVSNQDGNWNIYRMNADGSNVQQITRHAGQDLSPLYGPIIDLSGRHSGLMLVGIGLIVLTILRSKYRKPRPEFV